MEKDKKVISVDAINIGNSAVLFFLILSRYY